MGKYASNAHVLGTCIKYCTNASPLGADGTYVWRPNIKGGKLYAFNDVLNTNGSFYIQADSGILWKLTDIPETIRRTQYGFNASLSNSIYTDNGKVYPASIALNFIIKA